MHRGNGARSSEAEQEKDRRRSGALILPQRLNVARTKPSPCYSKSWCTEKRNYVPLLYYCCKLSCNFHINDAGEASRPRWSCNMDGNSHSPMYRQLEPQTLWSAVQPVWNETWTANNQFCVIVWCIIQFSVHRHCRHHLDRICSEMMMMIRIRLEILWWRWRQPQPSIKQLL